MIDTAAALADFVPYLEPADPIAIDTEADSLHCYFEKLCLIQISVGEGATQQDVLIDPLARVPLEPLFTVLARKELIIHGADYDLRLLRRAGFAEPRAVFDTMIAARLSGHTEFSYAALVKRHFDTELVKGSQKANWARRPLSPAMEQYAKNDTHFLLALAGILARQLRELGRWDWFQQSCLRALETARTDRERDTENAWRITGSAELQGRAAAILRALWRWRDAEARATDRPAFHILHNEKLIESAQRFDLGERVSIPHLSPQRWRRFLDAADAGKNEPPEQWPRVIRKPRLRITPEQERTLKKLRARRDAAATALKLDPALIAPKSVLENLAFDPEHAPERLLPWQREILAPGE